MRSEKNPYPGRFGDSQPNVHRAHHCGRAKHRADCHRRRQSHGQRQSFGDYQPTGASRRLRAAVGGEQSLFGQQRESLV